MYSHDAKLRTAKTKPNWCSYRRWRIELARRRDAERYRHAPDCRLAAVNTGTHTRADLEQEY